MQHTVFPTPDGIAVAGVIIAKRYADGSFAVNGREEEIQVLLSAAYGKPVPSHAIGYIRRGSELLKQVSGDELYSAAHPFFPKSVTSGDNFSTLAKALMLFALSGLGEVEDSQAGKQRMMKAQHAIRRGVKPSTLLKKMQKAGFNPNEPRDENGMWTTGGASTAADSGSISTDDIRNTITSRLATQSKLPQGTQVATNDGVQSDAPASWGNPGTFDDHSQRHGADFNAASPEDYADQANKFMQNAEKNGYQIKVEPEGYFRVYDPETNTFGSYNPDGTTRTFYKPPGGQSYFNEQLGTVSVSIPSSARMPILENPSSGSITGGGGAIGADGLKDPMLDHELKRPID